MGLVDNESVGYGAQPTNDTASPSLTREDVRETVRQELLAMAAVPAAQQPSSSESQPAPPSYDDTARLLGADPRSPTAGFDGIDDSTSEAESGQSRDSAKAGKLDELRVMPVWVRLIVFSFLLFVPVGATLYFCLSGRDKLRLTVLAIILVVVHLFVMCLTFLVAALALGTEASPTPTEQKSKRQKQHEKHFLAFVVLLDIFLMFAAFSVVLWLWLVNNKGTLVPRFELAERFDGKITQHDALGTLTACLYDEIPEVNRNATLDVFTDCLKELGMPQIST